MTMDMTDALCCSKAVNLQLAGSVIAPARSGATPISRVQAVRQALMAARIGILDVRLPDGDGYFSPECLEVLGYTQQDADAFMRGWLPLVHPNDLPVYTTNWRRALGGETNRLEIEVRRMRSDGSYRWVRMVGRVLERDAAGLATRLVATMEDVETRHDTEDDLRAAQHQLQALSAHVEAHLEAERKLIASEVHDQCGQVLTLVKMEIAALRSAARQAPLMLDSVQRLDDLVDDLVQLSRDVIARLRPPALDLGLVPALEWLAADWTRQTGLACEFTCTVDDLALPDDKATTLFRIVQESLTNAARHAQAAWVHVGLRVNEDGLDLRVADNGRGFDTGADHAGHFGLLGMRERAQRVGAHLEVNSAPGAGTQVRVSMPLPATAPPASALLAAA